MNRLANKYQILLSLAFFLLSAYSSVSFAGTVTSAFNGLGLDLDEEPQGYSFLVGGHLYGSSSDQSSVYPSPTILMNLDKINSRDARCFISLGDIIREATPIQMETFVSSLADNLHMPFFNAVGNHDVLHNRGFYEDRFGKTYYHFVYSGELFVVLDTQMDYGRVSGRQLQYLLKVLEDAGRNPKVHNIFIFTHDPIWHSSKDRYREFFFYSDIGNFNKAVLPALRKLAGQKNIYWFSDNIGGAKEPLPFFYDFDEANKVTYIATGLGNTVNDAIIRVNINRRAEVSFTPIALVDQKVYPLESYNVRHWRRWKSLIGGNGLKAKILRRFKNQFFITGLLFGAFFAAAVYALFRVVSYKMRHKNRRE